MNSKTNVPGKKQQQKNNKKQIAQISDSFVILLHMKKQR